MNKKSFFQCVILLISFLVLTLAVESQSDMVSYLDNITSAFFQSIRNPDLTNLMTIISTVVSPLTTSLIALVILGYQYFLNQRIAVWLFMLFFGTNALALLLKDIIARHRPMNQLVFDSGYSFPSGHTISTFFINDSCFSGCKTEIEKSIVTSSFRNICISNPCISYFFKTLFRKSFFNGYFRVVVTRSIVILWFVCYCIFERVTIKIVVINDKY
ncbi:Phosphoesterase [Streptococcus agalactiae]|nr:Phosphoesterase [Streptococcus agalactiae]AUP32219.1 Phosphoesterase [Streptococcus agalactiae]AUP37267.1 Phosphoesterase [Streptococcus agalactiae]AUP38948.1 Phosphoesterase [Streptococcus agalactiae]